MYDLQRHGIAETLAGAGHLEAGGPPFAPSCHHFTTFADMRFVMDAGLEGDEAAGWLAEIDSSNAIKVHPSITGLSPS
ncbi:MAG: hypothetical protein AAF160_04655 [Pseudomonadota bacterium]